jgi:hypothetical protein
MWEGAGAVREVGDLGPDTLAFRNAIIHLAAEMDRQGIGLPRSRNIAEIFRQWNHGGL